MSTMNAGVYRSGHWNGKAGEYRPDCFLDFREVMRTIGRGRSARLAWERMNSWKAGWMTVRISREGEYYLAWGHPEDAVHQGLLLYHLWFNHHHDLTTRHNLTHPQVAALLDSPDEDAVWLNRNKERRRTTLYGIVDRISPRHYLPGMDHQFSNEAVLYVDFTARRFLVRVSSIGQWFSHVLWSFDGERFVAYRRNNNDWRLAGRAAMRAAVAAQSMDLIEKSL